MCVASCGVGRATLIAFRVMAQADLLSDRIAIMTAGKMACMGSSVFLKKRFGLGFSLTMVKTNDKVALAPLYTRRSTSHRPNPSLKPECPSGR